MILNYNATVAAEVGANAATIFHSICFWVYQNQKNETNFHDGRHWIYNTQRAWAEYYPNLNERQVRLALDKLEETGYIVSACYNKNRFDRTKWYSVTEKGAQYFPEIDSTKMSNVHSTKMSNDARDIGTSDINTDKLPNAGNARANLNKPLNAQEVREEAGKRHRVITESQAQDFIDRYEATASGGTWMIGNTVVTDWRRLLTSRWLDNWRQESASVRNDSGNSGEQSMDEFAESVRLEREALGIK